MVAADVDDAATRIHRHACASPYASRTISAYTHACVSFEVSKEATKVSGAWCARALNTLYEKFAFTFFPHSLTHFFAYTSIRGEREFYQQTRSIFVRLENCCVLYVHETFIQLVQGLPLFITYSSTT